MLFNCATPTKRKSTKFPDACSCTSGQSLIKGNHAIVRIKGGDHLSENCMLGAVGEFVLKTQNDGIGLGATPHSNRYRERGRERLLLAVPNTEAEPEFWNGLPIEFTSIGLEFARY